MDSESIYYQSNISELFHKNLYTFKSTEYKVCKEKVIHRIEIYLDIKNILDTIIDKSVHGSNQ